MTKKQCVIKLKKLRRNDIIHLDKFDWGMGEKHRKYVLDVVATYECAIKFLNCNQE